MKVAIVLLTLTLAAPAQAQDGVRIFHDAAGRVTDTARTDSNGVTTFHDAVGRVTARPEPTATARPHSTTLLAASPARSGVRDMADETNIRQERIERLLQESMKALGLAAALARTTVRSSAVQVRKFRIRTTFLSPAAGSPRHRHARRLGPRCGRSRARRHRNGRPKHHLCCSARS